MTNFDPMEFATLIVDECHHYTAASYRRVIDYYLRNPWLRVLGITATPDRADGKAMGQIFKSVAFDFGIRYMSDNGWLVPIDQRAVAAHEIDLSDVGDYMGDLSGSALSERMEEEGPLHAIAKPTMDEAGDRRTLVFAAGVRHAELLSNIFNARRAGSSNWVSEKTPRDERREMFAAYRRGDFQYLVNVGIATEGFNDPGIECVSVARPTKSRGLYTQMIGRGTRALPGVVDPYEHASDRLVAIAESAKPSVLVLDFVCNSGRHKLVTAADVLAGDYEPAVVARAKRIAEAATTPAAVVDTLRAAAAQVHAEREAAAAREADRWRAVRNAVKVDYATESVDPFDLSSSHATPAGMGWNKGTGATEGQVAFLERYAPKGVDVSRMTKGQAGAKIADVKRRFNEGLCTWRQSVQLESRGLPADVPKAQAEQWLDAIANNNWRTPPELMQYVRNPDARKAG
jgi:superfamily II DNA or RNA helicase